MIKSGVKSDKICRIHRIIVTTFVFAILFGACAKGRNAVENTPLTEFSRCEECHGLSDRYATLSSTHEIHSFKTVLAGTFDCEECHLTPASPSDIGHGLDQDGDGIPDALVTFGELAATGDLDPTWDGKRCSNVYCHGATLSGGNDIAPLWKGTNTESPQCGSCHAILPAQPHLQNNDCKLCHPTDGTKHYSLTYHVNGQLDVKRYQGLVSDSDCATCHGTPPKEGHISTADACNLCHPGNIMPDGSLNQGQHMDGQLELINWTGDQGQPGCGECHGLPPDVEGHLNVSQCSLCHTTNWDLHINGTVDVAKWDGSDPKISCGDCHGLPPKDDHPQVSNCQVCHQTYLNEDGSINQDIHMNGQIDY